MDLADLDFPPFVPHPLLANAHAMTIAGALPRRGLRAFARTAEQRTLSVDDGTRITASFDWQEDRNRSAALVLVHGLAGSSAAPYMLGTAAKAHAAGLHVARINVRNCGNTEELTASAYHGGLTEDVWATMEHLVHEVGVARVFLGGFSLGGNLVLKLAGELGDEPPAWLAGVVGVSPCVDFAAAADRLNEGFLNRLYQRRFVAGLKRILRRRNHLTPDAFPLDGLDGVRTIREFDDRFTAPLSGFRDVDDYYERASALPWIAHVRVPALLIAAIDDPMVPFASLTEPPVRDNPRVRLLATEHGGHAAFVGRAPAVHRGRRDLDRFWAESRLVQLCVELLERERETTPDPARLRAGSGLESPRRPPKD